MDRSKVDTLALRRLKVKSESSENILFKDLYQDKKVTFVFIRHFGCIACRAHVTQVMEQVKAGALKTAVIFIGNGQPSMIKAFKEDIGFPNAEIYTDPTLEIFDACGLKRGLTYLLNASSLKGFYRLRKEGFSQGEQGRATGVHRQMGGIVVISKLGEVLYHYSSHFLGDFPTDSDN